MDLSKLDVAIIIDALSRTIHEIEMKNYHGNPYGYGENTTKYLEELKETYYKFFDDCDWKTLDEVMIFLSKVLNAEDQ